MSYSLRSRFRGAVLGAAIGETLGAAAQASLPHSLHYPVLEDGAQRFEPSDGQSSLSYGRAVITVAEALIFAQQHHPSCLDLPEAVWGGGLGAGLAIASLPLVLYYHEDLDRLQRQLQCWIQRSVQNSESTQNSQSTYNSQPVADLELVALVMGDSMALILQEQQVVRQLIPQVLTDLELPSDHFVGEGLQRVQALLHRRASLSTAVQELRSLQAHPNTVSDLTPNLAPDLAPDLVPLLLALYCFLSTPEDFRLTVLRAVRTGVQPQLTGAIAGAFSAAYNGLPGVPGSWQEGLFSSTLEQLWGVKTSPQLFQLADRLLALWAGAYDPQQFLQQLESTGTIAAPEVIRPR